MSNLNFILIVSGVIVVTLIILGVIMARMYHRASKERSFVRTGAGGQKVIINGGALVLPVLHEIIHINMNTLKLGVNKQDQEALITKDKMRINVSADFYIRVKPDASAIASAAQTLGSKTMQPNELRPLLEGKFVDSLRSVAAEMDMSELYEKRANFVQKVQQTVAEDLLKNGMELETVSLTSLDQTDMKFFNPENAFDAEGLTKLTEIVQSKRKIRNDITQETEIQIKQRNLEAGQLSLEIDRKTSFLEADQKKEVEIRAAEADAETKSRIAAQGQKAAEAEIAAEQSVSIAKLNSDKAKKEEQIKIARELEIAQIQKEKTIELENQDRNVSISLKSEEQSKAAAKAAEALALAKAAEEKVTTAKNTEIANRDKAIAIIKAEEDASTKAVGVTIQAAAEKDAAMNLGEAVKIKAQADADAIIIKAEANERMYEVEANGKRKLNEADNTISAEIISMRVKLRTVEELAAIIQASLKPIEAIKDMKVINVAGLFNKGGSAGESAAGGTQQSMSSSITDSLLSYRMQAPLVDTLLKEVGITDKGLESLIKDGIPQPSSNTEVHVENKATAPIASAIFVAEEPISEELPMGAKGIHTPHHKKV